MNIRSYVQLEDGKQGVWETRDVDSLEECIEAVLLSCKVLNYKPVRVLHTILPEEAQT